MSSETLAPSTRSRKIRAVLAGGLVLGVGAAVTLAAWNDSEFMQGGFGAGTFNLQGSADGGETWTDHDEETAAVVFAANEYDNLTPGDVVYETSLVRLAAGTTSPATLSFAGSNGSGGNAANFSFDVYADSPSCDADGAASGTALGSGDSLSAGTAANSVPLPIGEPTSEAGTAVQLCFVVTASQDLVQGAGAGAVWEFEAVSVNE